MSPDTALLLFGIGVAGLFYLDREPNAKITKALWLPTLWILINGSRPVSAWLGGTGPMRMAGAQYQQAIMEGNPVDAAVLGLLLALALIVLLRRRQQTAAVLRWMWPILAYFGYCLLSVLWSDIPDIASKRWVKSLGDLAMALVVATEPDIAAALRRLASRAGIWLLPASYMVIRYFPAIGRGFDVDGNPSNIGLTTNKNLLGDVAFLLTLAALWQVLSLRGASEKGRRRRVAAQVVILAFGIAMLYMAHSATSVAAALFGSALLIALSLPAFRKPAAVHGLVALILVAGMAAFALGAEGSVTHDLGRKSNLTGRTYIWSAVLAQAAEHPILGVGFESFWTGSNDARVLQRMPAGMIANESHDGYIEVYAELGLCGLALVIWVLATAYRRAVATLAQSPGVGRFLVACVAALAIYNITEAGFRMLDPPWAVLLLCFACAAGILAGPTVEKPRADGRRLASRFVGGAAHAGALAETHAPGGRRAGAARLWAWDVRGSV